MWSPNELLKTEKQRDILSYITLQFFPFKKVPLEHYPFAAVLFIFSILVYGYVPGGIILESETVFDLIFPCALFAFLIFKGVAQKDKA